MKILEITMSIYLYRAIDLIDFKRKIKYDENIVCQAYYLI